MVLLIAAIKSIGQKKYQISINMTRKSIWLREEISIADELLALAPKLLQEFLEYHTDFIVGDFAKGIPYTNPNFDVGPYKSRPDSWKIDPLKYTNPKHSVLHDGTKNDQIRQRFPTAVALTEKYGAHCPVSAYSILEHNAVIARHTGVENRDGLYVRIHIPLLVPPGDIFFEVEGVEIDWSDLFAFDNQFIHSAYNYTDQRRLVYLLDLHRDVLGLEPGIKTNFERFDAVPEFVRGQIPKVLHTCQK